MPKPFRSPFPPLALDPADQEVSTCRPKAQPSQPKSRTRPASRKRELAELLRGEDFGTALAVAEEILAADPGDLEAREAKLRSEDALEEIYARRLGSLSHVPVLAVTMKDLPGLAIDNRSAFVLSLVDGVSTIDMILDMSGMPRLEALRLLYEMTKSEIVVLS